LENAIRRLDIGGKVLTNLLKEAVTYRQWNMMDEYHIVNDAKEQLCFVSDQFDKEMKQARIVRRGMRWFDREYLLPDFMNTFRGTVQLPAPLQRKRDLEEEKEVERQQQKEKEHKQNDEKAMDVEDTVDATSTAKLSKKGTKKKSKDDKRKKSVQTKDNADNEMEESDDNISDEESDQQRLQRLRQMREQEQKRREQESLERQALAMSVERFAIPEVLFRPSDIGLDCGGIAEGIVESISACDATLRAAMYNNVLLVGGNARMPGYKERVEVELRKLAPVNYSVRVYLPEDSVSYAWEGSKEFAKQPDFQKRFTIDRISWEAMKKAGKDQTEIWGERVSNNLREQ